MKIELEKIYNDKDWNNFKGKAMIPIGAENEIDNIVGTLENGFNFLLCGKAGSGKSNFFHCAITNLLKNVDQKDLKLILIDLHGNEFNVYKKLPNLFFPVVADIDMAAEVLEFCCNEILGRADSLFENKMKTIEEYNQKFYFKIPRILIVIDECFDLMFANYSYFEELISNIAKFGYFVNVNILVGISSLSTGNIFQKNLADSFKLRAALKTFTAYDSKLVLGVEGAEKLRGKGRMYYFNSEIKDTTLLQSFYIGKEEIKNIVEEVISKK